jgi:hypothetical protein
MWRTFVITFLGIFGVGVATLFGFIVLVDPYDAGRFGAAWTMGVADENSRVSHASRGRDSRFNSVVIGNSRGQLIDPARLSAASGLQFVQLTVAGTGPREQLALLHWFVRHHAHVGAIVVVADPTWCTQDSSLPIQYPFPFWLYADSDLDYAVNALNTGAIRRGWGRVLIALRLRQRSDPSGYQDYERGRAPTFAPAVPQDFRPAGTMRDPQRPFPAIERLKAFLAERAGDVPLVIVFPPAFVTDLPAAGSAEGVRIEECKGALAALVRDSADFLDLAVDSELARDPANFMDTIHYRAAVAREIEAQIVSALARR